MGAKTWMLVYSNGNPGEVLAAKPLLDREATAALAQKLFPAERLDPLEDGDLLYTNPPDGELRVGSFPGAAIVAAKEFAIDRPSELPPHFLDPSLGNTVHLHAMHSVVDWFAFAIWRDGVLQRSLSVSPDSGVIEDIGTRLPFELPYWDGRHPAIDPDDLEESEDPYPLPFHPLELGEAALLEFFGYQIEGVADVSLHEPDETALMSFKRKQWVASAAGKGDKPWWKLW